MTSVLITNDDGYESPGLWALVRAAVPFASSVTVVAPKINQSAVGAGFTLRRELTWERIAEPPVPGVDAWHVDGTPADCIIVATTKLLHEPVDLVLSGVNRGANVGNDVLASGTVGGALAGHLRGLAAVAFSVAVRDDDAPHWDTAEEVAAIICQAHAERTLPGPTFLNVNIPSIPFEDITGMVVTRMGPVGFVKLSEAGSSSVVLERDQDVHTNPNSPPGTDVWALSHRYVSVSPLQANLTDHRSIDSLGTILNAAFRRTAPGTGGG